MRLKLVMPRYCLFLGAGFSKWCCDLPLVGGLFDLAIHVDNAIEAKRLARLENLFGRWRSSNPAEHPEKFVAFAQSRPRTKALVNWYITRRLTDPFVAVTGMRRTFYINSYRAQSHPGVSRARLFFERILGFASLSIITTNYDMVPEYALSSRGMNYGVIGEEIGRTPYPYIQPVFATGRVSLAKLHGSVSWSEKGNKTTDSRFGLNGRGLIVPPVSEKEPPPLLADCWALARRVLAETETLVVFGFSFNDNDIAVRELVAGSLRPSARLVFVDAIDHRPRLSFLVAGRDTRFVSSLEVADEELFASILNDDPHRQTQPTLTV